MNIEVIGSICIILVEAIIIIYKEFQFKKEKNKSKSIIDNQINEIKHIDHEFIEMNISEITKIGERLINKNLSDKDIEKIKHLIYRQKAKLYESLLFSDDTEKVKQAIAYLKDNKDTNTKFIIFLFMEKLKSRKDAKWHEVRNLFNGLFKK